MTVLNKKSIYEISESCQIPRLEMYFEDIFGNKTDGTFIDVGAYDGKWTSNTSALAKLGWTGRMIEPVPSHYNSLCENIKTDNWKNTIALNYAIGNSDNIFVDMLIKGTLSTINTKQMEAFKHFDWCKDRFEVEPEHIQVPLITLNRLLRQNLIGDVDVLSIDVEGWESEVLKGFEIDRWKPKMVIIETCGLHHTYNNYQDLRENMEFINSYMNKPEYTLYFKDYINSIWIRK